MDVLEEIKAKINIVDLIQEYIPLKPSGRNFKAVCPFHNEKTPSFMVSPERQIWHCFGCGEGGDIFGFVMKMEGLEFGEALRVLAKKAGVPLKEYRPAFQNKKNRFYEINSLAAKFFNHVLISTSNGAKTRSYLDNRNINKETIDEFSLGYAPDRRNLLIDFLKKRKFSMQEILEAGLAVQRRNGGNSDFFDMFRNRLVFPIKNLHGDVCGFTGRALNDEDMPKYLNTPQTLVFDKSKVLYALDRAREQIKKNDLAVIVEGQMDVLASHQAGVKNVVCSSGTALTQSQIDLIKRFTDKIALAMDMDEAGANATKRVIDILMENDISTKVIKLPTGKDPDECIKKDSVLWEKAIKKAENVMDFYFEEALKKLDVKKLSVDDRKSISKELLPKIKKVKDRIEQACYVQSLAKILNVKEITVLDALQKTPDIQIKKFVNITNEPIVKKKTNRQTIEELLVGLLILFPREGKKNISKVKSEDLIDENLQKIYKALQLLYASGKKFKLATFEKELSEELVSELNKIILEVDFFYGSEKDKDVIANEIDSYLCRIKRTNLFKKKKIISEELEKAEKENNKNKIKKLMQEFQKLISEEKKFGRIYD